LSHFINLENKLILIAALLFLASCEYKPKGEYYRNLVPTPPGSVTISIQDHSDTLIMFYHNTFSVKVECQDRKVVYYRMYIDGVMKEEKVVDGSGIMIDPLAYIEQDRVYTLTIEVGISSGSGSIGDELGAEGYTFGKDFILAVLLNQTSYSPYLEFDRSDGRMRLFVDVPSNIQNVRKMVFSKALANSPMITFDTVIGSGHFEAIDNSYVGEYAYYNVEVFLGDLSGTIFTHYTQGGTSVAMDLPELTITPSERGFPLLRWCKSHYPDNVGSYRIYGWASGHASKELLGTNTDVNDTGFEATGTVFPGYYTFHVATIPHHAPSFLTDQVAWDNYSSEEYAYVGRPSFYYYSCLAPEGHFLYFGSGSNDISEYSVLLDTVTRVFTTPTGWFYTKAVSPNAKYILAATGIQDFQYLFIDLTTNQEQWIPSSQVVGAGKEAGIISVSDNGIASISTGNRIVVYDFVNQTQIKDKTFSSNVERTVISGDGQYIFAYADKLYLYKLVSSTLVEKWNSSGTPGTIKFYSFYPSNNGLAVLFIDQNFYTRNCETWALVNSFPMDITDLCNIDFTSGHILGKTDQDIKVYGLSSGNKLFQNPVIENAPVYYFRLKNNTVYYSGGKKLIIF